MSSTEDSKNELALAWINLNYTSTSLFTRQTKPILIRLNGQVNFHSLTALMGPSGAGKTTLLKCINLRNTEGLTTDSKIFVNKSTQLRASFIMQESSEYLLKGLTVRESLLFASKIKNLCITPSYRNSYAQTGDSLLSFDSNNENEFKLNDNSFEVILPNGTFDHKINVERILSELLLTDCSSNLVDNCSGGEQKRLSMGLELVNQLKPNLLCIDEPTSGLDSNAAEVVIQCLSQLTGRHQMAIVTSIHQPNSLLLNIFDHLYVLSKGGHCVYSGRPQLLRQYLENNGINCAEDVLPIELLLKISSNFPKNKLNFYKITNKSKFKTESNKSSVEQKGQINKLIAKSYKNSTYIHKECRKYGKLLTNRIIDNKRQNFNVYHFYYLLLREFSSFLRYQWKGVAILLLLFLSIAILLIYLFGTDIGEVDGCIDMSNKHEISTKRTVRDAIILLGFESNIVLNLKLQLFGVAMVQLISQSFFVLKFGDEMKIFLSEHKNKWYSSSSYFWSKFVMEILQTIIISVIYSIIIYYGSGQPNETFRFIYYTMIIISGMFVANSLGAFCGIIFCNNIQIALSLGITIYIIMMLLCGFFVPLKIQTHLFQKISNLSIIKFTFESALIIIYGRERCEKPNTPIMFNQLELNDDLLSTHFWYILVHLIVWRFIAMSALLVKANDFSWISIFKRKNQ